ncbi:MAG: hypothetical protein JG781_1417 [Peptococcaceae bacterium]|jgi:thiosulfate dehydrogenase [quinone] large subunit|nr:hypothetical protein [Peptococcaceae bacterium]
MLKIFTDKRTVPFWTLLRIWLGIQWLTASLGKLGNPVWTGEKAGVAITGFFKNTLTLASGSKPAVQGWYAAFIEKFALPNAKIFSYLIPIGEFAVGLGLIVGGLTTIALLGGAFMNLNFMLAGTTSTNPILYTAAILLLAAGTNARTWGVDSIIAKYLFTNKKPKDKLQATTA